MANHIITKLVNDIRVELSEEFDQNFERKAFFTEKWKETRMPNQQGSLMARSGNLRASIQSHQTDTTITWSSSLLYASIHNQGGEIKVTHKMKKFFWAMYYHFAGAISKSHEKADGSRILFISVDSKNKMQRQAKSNKSKDKERNKLAEMWKMLALKPIGSKVVIPQRQFIGDHPEVNRLIEQVFEDNESVFEQYLNTHFGI